MSYCCQDKKYFSELCPSCVKAMTTFEPEKIGYYAYPTNEHANWEEVIFDVKCECGSDKTNGPGHSHWCPKYENKT